ncbi:MAG TPA: M20/M25/M40 family metallo-hydrolase [Bacillota bacterium]|nr:M20/M25/M40 family metallo-hydrolase [Bacillota bacterium]
MADKSLSSYARYAIEGIGHVIENFGPRDPGSEGEKLAQEYVAQEMARYTNEVKCEEFTVHPRAFMGFMPVIGVLLIAAIALYWLGYALPSLVFTSLAVLVFLLQFLFYRRFLDPFFPAAKSLNVTGIYRAEKETKRRVFICGHIDAAYEWRYFINGGRILLILVIVGTMASALLKLAIDAYAVTAVGAVGTPAGAARVLGFVQLVGIPFFLASLFFSDFKNVVPGANDNLSGVFTAMAVVKYLSDQGIRFQHTEVCCLSTGSEEAGLRGAKAYAEKHARSLSDAETIFIVLETLGELEHMSVYNRDMSGTVKNDPQVSALLQLAGKKSGLDLPLASVYLGSSDAAAFSQAGLKASALAAMDPAPARYYHTRLDHKENLSAECIAKAIEVTLEAVKIFDEKGLQI